MSKFSRQNQIHAVITGDLVASTKFVGTELQTARECLEASCREFAAAKGRSIVGRPDFFRGDSWQLLMNCPSRALLLAIFIYTRLRSDAKVATRISIGLGFVEDIHSERISMSSGEAFVLSGRSLDRITGYFDLTGALPKRAGPLVSWFTTLLHLCSGYARLWTQRQSEVIAHAILMDNPTHQQIANTLIPAVKKQSVTDTLTSANWRVFQEALNQFEDTPWQEILKNDKGT